MILAGIDITARGLAKLYGPTSLYQVMARWIGQTEAVAGSRIPEKPAP
jgi:hypothetical protein